MLAVGLVVRMLTHASWSLILSMPTNVCLAELPLNLNLSVKRFTVDTQSVAAFICTVSKVNLRVSWYRGDKKLYPSRKYEIVDDGCTHKLIVHELSVEDYDDYVVVIGSRRMTGCMLREGECVCPPRHVCFFVCLCLFLLLLFSAMMEPAPDHQNDFLTGICCKRTTTATKMYEKDFKITVPVKTKVSMLGILKRMPLCLFVSNFSPEKKKKAC